MRILSRHRTTIAYLAYFLLHVGFDAAARMFEVSPGISLWYPPVGLALALVTMFGLRAAPVVLAANLYSGLIGSMSPVSWIRIAVPLVITAAYVMAGWLIHRRFGPRPRPANPAETALLIGFALLAPLFAAAVGTALVWEAGLIAPGQSLFVAFQWWIGDLTGVLTATPLCLVHLAPWIFPQARHPRRKTSRRATLEIVAQTIVLLGFVWIAHGASAVRDYHAYYLGFVPLIWICLRHGFPGATIATCTLTMSSLAAVNYYGGTEHVVVDLLLFVISVTVVGLGLGWSVSRRAQAETESSRLLAILEATSDFVGTCDLDGRILYQNSALLRLRGRSGLAAVRGMPVQDLLPAWAAEKRASESVPTALRDGIWHGETALIDAEGREVPVSQVILAHFEADGEPVMLSTIARDISAQKRAEQGRLESERNVLQAQKLESLGVLAGGIAHDFNNLLTVMLGNASLARLELSAESSADHCVHQIELAALRAAELCRQMLAYSGKGHLSTDLVNLGRIVEETIGLLKVSISKKCSLEFQLSPELPAVIGDATQLNQITMNLVMNASDACGENGGRIVVRTGSMHADREYLRSTYLAPDVAPGMYAYLEVSDNGCGMSADVLARIFEPFFTTKFSGHGLGLSAVLGIARSHRGAVKVESAPGRGSTFRLLLPAASASAPPASQTADRVGDWRGEGCILVVDDEDAVREIAARILEHHGFTTMTAEDGRRAVEAFAQEPTRFSAVLLDLSMPVLDGREAFREMHRINPDVPVILMSGYNRTDSEARFSSEGLAGFLQKPFESSQLVAAVRTVLDDNEAAA